MRSGSPCFRALRCQPVSQEEAALSRLGTGRGRLPSWSAASQELWEGRTMHLGSPGRHEGMSQAFPGSTSNKIDWQTCRAIEPNTKIYIDRRSVRIANRSASIPKWLVCEVKCGGVNFPKTCAQLANISTCSFEALMMVMKWPRQNPLGKAKPRLNRYLPQTNRLLP